MVILSSKYTRVLTFQNLCSELNATYAGSKYTRVLIVSTCSKQWRGLTFQKKKMSQELKAAYGSGYLISVRFAEDVDLASVSQQLVSALRALSPGLKVEDILKRTICGDFAQSIHEGADF